MYRKRSKKMVTWSPIVQAVSRPCSLSAKKLKKSRSVFNMTLNGREEKRVSGNAIAHARENTRNLLLTLKKDHKHREFQLLIDLPHQRIKRLYDGKQSYTVVREDSQKGETLSLHVKLGNIFWKKDDVVREAKARGFSLAWVNGTNELQVEKSVLKSSRRKSRRDAKKRRLS